MCRIDFLGLAILSQREDGAGDLVLAIRGKPAYFSKRFSRSFVIPSSYHCAAARRKRDVRAPQRQDVMAKRTIVVNDRMQRNYRYDLTAAVGRGFDPEFKPDLNPRQMLAMGVFCGKYMTDCAGEFPEIVVRQGEARGKGQGLYAELFRRRRQPAALRLEGEGLGPSGRSARLVPVVLPLLHGAPAAG